MPHGLSGFKEALAKVAQLRSVPPKHVKGAPCQQIVLTDDQVDLNTLPALHTWPQDGGSFFNLGLTLRKAGREAEARPYLESYLKAAPPALEGRDIARVRIWLRAGD